MTIEQTVKWFCLTTVAFKIRLKSCRLTMGTTRICWSSLMVSLSIQKSITSSILALKIKLKAYREGYFTKFLFEASRDGSAQLRMAHRYQKLSHPNSPLLQTAKADSFRVQTFWRTLVMISLNPDLQMTKKTTVSLSKTGTGCVARILRKKKP